MRLPQNQFRRALAAGHRQIGVWSGLGNAYCSEIAAAAGFDWILIDGEHGPVDLPILLGQLQAVSRFPTQAVVRTVNADRALIKQVLDVGAQTLLVPMIESAEQAAAVVAATRYPPHGVRGVGSALARAALWGQVEGYLAHAAEELCVLVQVENAAGLQNLEAIASVEGIDGVFIGPSDLAASLGYIGRAGASEVQAAIADALGRLKTLGKPSGILATDPAQARRYMDAGAAFVAVAVDAQVLVSGLAAARAQFI